MEIRLLKREEIEKEKWNGCVHYAPNGNVFGYTWYLDTVAKDWEGLVEGDYQSVFPLVYRKQWSGSYALFQPELMRSMGIYSVHVLSAIRIKAFLEAIPDLYKNIDITLGARNQPPRDDSFRVDVYQNQLLDLNLTYDQLRQQYHPEMLEKLKEAEDRQLVPLSSVKPEKMADWYRQFGAGQSDPVFHALQRVMYNVMHRGTGFATAITYPGSDEMLAADFFIFSHSRMLSLLPLVSPAGREAGAPEMLLDLMIRSNAKRPLLLDFNTETPTDLGTRVGAREERFFRIRRQRRLLGLVY